MDTQAGVKRPKVYVAGPDVFFDNYEERAHYFRTVLDHLGIEALLPADDGPIDEAKFPTRLLQALEIRRRNLEKIRTADGVISNLRSFRGFVPDDGTVYETAWGECLGKVVIGYQPDLRSLRDKIPHVDGEFGGAQVEDFGLPINLMLASVPMMDSFHAAANAMANLLRAKAAVRALTGDPL